MDCLDPEILFAEAQRPAVIGGAGEVRGSVPSTMDLAVERAAEGAPDGYVVAAEYQSEGRGRVGRWQSGVGRGLLVSVILRAKFRSSERMLVGIMGAVAAAEALIEIGLAARIKWPNDIVGPIDDDGKFFPRKVGGVLVEQLSRGDAVPIHILGIGLNVNQAGSQLPDNARMPPASYRTETGKTADRNRLCLYLFRRLDTWYKKLALGRPETVLARWKTLSCLLNRRVRMRHRDTVMQGTVLGLSASGHLIFQEEGGGEKHYFTDRDAKIVLTEERKRR